MIYLSGALLLLAAALVAGAALIEVQAGQATLRGLKRLAPSARTLRSRLVLGHVAA